MSLLDDVPEDKRFHVCDGTVIKNIEELENALKKMSKETFRRHSDEEKNYFAEWVRNAIGDDDLADMIKDKNKGVASVIIRKWVEGFKKTKLGKCPNISPILECIVGGYGAANCLDPLFHENCEFRKKNSKGR